MLDKTNISKKKQSLIIYILLILATLAVFWQLNQYGFINFDDNVYVTENFHIQSGITPDGFRWAFSTIHAEFWHPLTWLSLMFDYQLHGLNAGGYHITNLIFHILSALLLFWLFNRMTGAVWKSAFVAAFFALHPLHVESVAWISERKDVLSAFFWMLTLCLYVYYTEKPVIRRYLLVLFAFLCALMSKPMVVTLPVIMILLDYWPLKRFESQKGNWVLWQLKEKIHFFILSAVFSIITLFAQHNPSANGFSLISRLANAPVSFVTYLEKTFLPHDLAVFYPFNAQIPIWQVLGTSLLIIIISMIVIVMIKRLPYLFAGWLWYAITLAPVIGIIQVGDFAMADRYTYIPSIGIAVMLAWGIPSLIKSEDMRKMILLPVGIAMIAVLAVLTWQQCGYWENSIKLFNHALNLTRDNYLAHNNIATSLAKEGKIKEAFYHYNEAIRIKPHYPDAYNNRGIVYGGLGQYQRALEDFNEAIRIKSNYAEAYNNRGFTYYNIGQYQRAGEDYNKAIMLKPDYTNAYINRVMLYINHGNKELGCYDAQKACDLGNCKTLAAAKARGYCR
jgi:protein O-mannosyl-transferase